MKLNESTLTIILPTYNEEKTVVPIIKKILSIDLPPKTELIIVDDGSSDNTAKVLSRFKKYNKIKIIKNEKNVGKGKSLRRGLKEAKGDYIVFFDTDNEYSPSDIKRVLDEFKKTNHDIIYGSRFLGEIKGMKIEFFIGNKILSFFTSVFFNIKVTDVETGIKAFKREIIDSLILKSNKFDIEIEISAKLLKMGHVIHEIPINYKAIKKRRKIINWKDGVIGLLTLFKIRFTDSNYLKIQNKIEEHPTMR